MAELPWARYTEKYSDMMDELDDGKKTIVRLVLIFIRFSLFLLEWRSQK